MIWATVNSQSCFCWLYEASPSWLKRIYSIWFWYWPSLMSMCRVFSCVVERGCLLWSVCSLGKILSLCPVSFCTPRPNLPVTSGVSWLLTFAFQSPIMKRISFLSVLKGPVGLPRTIQLQLIQHYWLGHSLGLLWSWMVCLGNEQRSFCHFWDYIQVLHFGLFCWLWWLFIV